MQQISRIYLGNCGYETAWYDGVTLDLRDEDWHTPTDTVLNLENGGGKTSLLSLIFSCFETSQDKFLKHIQSKNNHFSQYFANDGTLGLILVEWFMPPRKTGDGSYHFITGQAVAVRTTTEPADVERLFFSFEETEQLSLEQVPGSKLCDAPLLSMGEFSRWIHDQQRADSGNVFITRKQSDWHRHLEASLIDIEMLRMQVEFSAQEGGFDAGFLNFKSEAEFLRKFFSLTLNVQRASTVRADVAIACDKLRRKPHFQKQLTQLQSLLSVLGTFSAAAAVLREERAQRIYILWNGKRLSEALTIRANALELESKTDSEFAKAQRDIETTQEGAAKRFAEDHATLTDLSFMRKTEQAVAALKKLRSDLEKAEKDVLHIQAAQLQREIKAAENEFQSLDTLSAQKKTELAPYREKVERDGALLRRALHDAAEALRTQARELKAQNEARSRQAKALRREIEELGANRLKFSDERTKLLTELDAAKTAHQQLLVDGALASDIETASEALERLDLLIEQLEAERQAYLEQQSRREAEALEWQATAEKERVRASALKAEISAKNVFVAEGCAERERLSQSYALTAAAETDVVTDLESLALTDQLDKRISSFSLQVTSTDIRLAELQADSDSIENTGVAGFSPDVALIVRELQKRGIKSAQPFNQYLAKAIPDAQRTRTLVQSDPARFLGVCVASAEMDACRAVAWGETLPAKPVVISPCVLESVPSDSAVVVPPSGDAAYHLEAAQALKQQLAAKQKHESSVRRQLEEQRDQTLAARNALLAYRAKYGEGKLGMTQEQIVLLKGDMDAAEMAAGTAKQKDTDCINAAKSAGTRAAEHGKTLETYDRHTTALGRFVSHHQSQNEQRQNQLEALKASLEQLATVIVDKTTEIDLLQELNEADAVSANTRTLDAAAFDNERAELEYYDSAVPAQEILKTSLTPLAALKTAYKAAATLYKSNEETRLGTLQAQLTAKWSEVIAKRQEFSKRYRGVTGLDLAPYRDADLEALLPTKERSVTEISAQMEPAVAAEAKAQATHVQWEKTNKVDVLTLTAEQVALSTAELAEAIATTDANGQLAHNKAAAAKEAAHCATEQAKQKADEAKGLRERNQFLNMTLQLDSHPEALLLELQLSAAGHDLASLQAEFRLEVDVTAQVKALIQKFNAKAVAYTSAEKKARERFSALITASQAPAFVEVEPEIASQMRRNQFESAVDDVQRLMQELQDRIAVVESNLLDMTKDFELAAEELHSLTQSAISTLMSATRKMVPAGAPYVGGKTILKMRSHLSSISAEDRRRVLYHYLDGLIESGIIPEKGTNLAAETILAINGKPLGLQILKMVIEESQQYVALDKITNSGGEGVVMAMFLYLIISQLRSDMQAREQKAGGGPLILDNPFAKATTPALWKAQRMLANSMGVQLIFATAVQDYNTLGEFGKFVRLRRAGQNTKTRRWHLETADFQLYEAAEGA